MWLSGLAYSAGPVTGSMGSATRKVLPLPILLSARAAAVAVHDAARDVETEAYTP